LGQEAPNPAGWKLALRRFRRSTHRIKRPDGNIGKRPFALPTPIPLKPILHAEFERLRLVSVARHFQLDFLKPSL
jgi:hypothetical protein